MRGNDLRWTFPGTLRMVKLLRMTVVKAKAVRHRYPVRDAAHDHAPIGMAAQHDIIELFPFEEVQNVIDMGS